MLKNVTQVNSLNTVVEPSLGYINNMNQRIEAEQIRHIYSQTPFFVPMVLFGSLLTIIVLWPATTPLVAIVWCLLIWVIYIGLWVHSRRWKKEPVDDCSMHDWALSYIVFSWLATISWGSIGILFFHADSFVYQSLLFIVLVIGSAAITATSTAYSPTFYPVVMMLLPLIIRLLYEKDIVYQLLASGLFAFTIMLFFLHRNSHAFYAASLQQRFINEALAAQLALQKDIAEQANISKSKFLAEASHDLRQPLHALSLFLGELREADKNGDPKQSLMIKMDESIKGLNDLFNGLLDVSRFEVGVVNPKLKAFNIDEILSNLCEEYSVRARAKALRFNGVACSAIVISDPLLLRRILRNLLENALRYTHKGGIVFGCRRKNGFIRIQILDSGIGIAAEYLQTVFNEFQQLGNPEGDQRKGIGLGLTVVKQLSQVLEHKLQIESVSGKGTVFSLDVPLADGPLILTDIERFDAVEDSLSMACILLVENKTSSSVIKKLLLSWGCRVLSTVDFKSIKSIINSSPFSVDVLIIDFDFSSQRNEISEINILCVENAQQVPAVLMLEDTVSSEIKNKNKMNILNKPVSPLRLATLLRFLLAKNNQFREH